MRENGVVLPSDCTLKKCLLTSNNISLTHLSARQIYTVRWWYYRNQSCNSHSTHKTHNIQFTITPEWVVSTAGSWLVNILLDALYTYQLLTKITIHGCSPNEWRMNHWSYTWSSLVYWIIVSTILLVCITIGRPIFENCKRYTYF